uniref:Lysosomal dipeptide transporter MFSD1 n=1 Tax=Moniliophthora roreri TaxID=221103 RepID=A0A0W0FWP8_MONRR
MATLPQLEKSITGDTVHNADEKTSISEPGLQQRSLVAEYPWRYKVPALICVLFFTLGSNWASSALSPLKSTLKEELAINNAQYGVIASANSLVNTILPIISGMAIDYYGPEIGSLLSSCFVTLGALIAAIGTTTSNYRTLIAGEVVLGLGSTTIETSQSKLYTHWFYGSHLGLVYGLDIAWGRVKTPGLCESLELIALSVISKATSVPIAEGTGSWTWSFWVACIMCAATLILNVFYCLLVGRLPRDMRTPTGREMSATGNSRRFSWLSLMSIPAAFWIIAITQAGSPFLPQLPTEILTADVIKQTRGTTDLTAGYTSSLSQVIPIVLTPALGHFFDRFGKRMWFVSGTALLYIVVFSLLAFTAVHPLVPVLLSSVALSFNALPFIAAIPLLVSDQAHIGTAFGIWKAFNNAGSTVMDIATGAIQDLTPTGRNTYNNVFYLLIALKGVDVIYGLFYDRLDKWQFGSVLRMNEARRVAKEKEDSSDLQRPLKRPQKIFTYIGIGLLGSMIVVAWTLYLIYAQGS